MRIENNTLIAENAKWLHNIKEDLYFRPGTKIFLGRRDTIENYEEVDEEPPTEREEQEEQLY